jgi:hypothetical protein
VDVAPKTEAGLAREETEGGPVSRCFLVQRQELPLSSRGVID